MPTSPFDLPTPPGRSRESTLRLRADGRFEHEGELVAHQGMQHAFERWVSIHPGNGRFVLANAQDWAYLRVDDTPLFVESILAGAPLPTATLSNGETLLLGALYQRDDGAILVRAHLGHTEVWAKFSRHAMFQLGEMAELEGNALRFFNGQCPLVPFVATS